MSKHNVLTEQEFSRFTPAKRTLHYIAEFCRRRGLSPGQVNILEWGCGRGRETLWLRERGYNAYGVDVDLEPMRNATDLFVKRGQDPAVLKVIAADGRTDFPDSFFHFTYSNQVFEHVSDLERVAQELWRVTAPDGRGHHVYPAYRYVVEGHLFMPLVHWLPKNGARRWLIRLIVALGREPDWPELRGRSQRDRTDAYYRYSIGKTFYRSPAQVKDIFTDAGFDTEYETINHPRVQSHPLLGRLARFEPTRSFVDWLLLTFVSNELRIAKC